MEIWAKLPGGTSVQLRNIKLTATVQVDGNETEIEIFIGDGHNERHTPPKNQEARAFGVTAPGIEGKQEAGSTDLLKASKKESGTNQLTAEMLEELAGKSDDFDSFIAEVCQKIHLDEKSTQMFTQAAKTLPHIKTITWESIVGIVRREGGNLTDEDVSNLKRALKELIRPYRPISLLNEIGKIYKKKFANNGTAPARQTAIEEEEITEVDLGKKLQEFADSSEDFHDFMDKVCEWLELSSVDAEFLKDVLEATKNLHKIAWPYIKENMPKCPRIKRDNLHLSVQRFGLKAMNLIKALAKYHNYEFSAVIVENEEPIHGDGEAFHQEVKREGPTQTLEELLKDEGIMNCFPFIVPLSEALKAFDKKRPVRENVEKVFEVMGLRTQKEIDPELAIKITCVALTGDELPNLKSSIMRGDESKETEDVCINAILRKAGVGEDQLLIERMNMHNFINNFRKQHGTEAETENIRVLDFLRELRRFADES